MVRSHIDYCNSVWAPYKKGIIIIIIKGIYIAQVRKGHKCAVEMLERVQKRATKILSQHRHLSYTDRLKVYKLPTLHYR